MATNQQPIFIREVYRYNLDAEFSIIRSIVNDFPFVAMDTEFPGAVCRSLGRFPTRAHQNYASLKANVDMMHVIQLGLTFSDEDGNLPMGNCIWQFNFCEFDVGKHPHMEDSVELLRKSGIDFQRNRTHGISAFRFADLLMSSGVVLNNSVHWITFHSSYDFAYLLSILTNTTLPQTLTGFLTLIRVFFPVIFDIKHLIKFCDSLYGGLGQVAKRLEIKRFGNSHLAGSDSHLTLNVFMKLKRFYFHGVPNDYAGVLFGLEI